MAENDLFEIAYATTRLARVRASDRESAKRRFAAYVLYDDAAYVESDVVVGNGEDTILTPALGAPPVAAGGSEMRAWLKRHDDESEAFEIGLYEDAERAIDPYLRLLATNDPWRLEGHGSLGRVLAAVPMHATLVTFDARVTYRFDAARYFDYVRLDIVTALDPARPQESVSIASLVDVCALHDADLRQIVSSYEAIANERRLTARFAANDDPSHPFDVRIAENEWTAYVAHRRADPERFLPPPNWTRA